MLLHNEDSMVKEADPWTLFAYSVHYNELYNTDVFGPVPFETTDTCWSYFSLIKYWLMLHDARLYGFRSYEPYLLYNS